MFMGLSDIHQEAKRTHATPRIAMPGIPAGREALPFVFALSVYITPVRRMAGVPHIL
jgi:hypothetical protein